MTLEEKGMICAPPLLSTYPEMVSQIIQQWEHIIAATHWYLYDNTKVDGADFYVGKQELGHIHLDGTVHLATNKLLRQHLLEKNLAQKFPFGGEYADWVQFKISNKQEADQAIWLFNLNYKRLVGVGDEELIRLISNL